MDHYHECLVTREPGAKDYALKILILAMTAALIALSVITALTMYPLLLIVGVGAGYLCYILMGMTNIEYEYIVVNADMDVDKIIGQRKRKRLISIKLNTVEELGVFTGKEGSNVNATVIATDNTGENMFYLIAEHSTHGKIMVLFTPDAKTVATINEGIPHTLRKKEYTLPDELQQSETVSEEKSDEKKNDDAE